MCDYGKVTETIFNLQGYYEFGDCGFKFKRAEGDIFGPPL